MKKTAGVLLFIVLVLMLVACNNSVHQEEYEEPIEQGESMSANYDNSFSDALIEDNAISPEPAEEQEEEPVIETEVFAGLNSSERYGDITHIVVHFISNVIENRTNPYILADIQRIFRDYGVSAHYIIDRDGTIHLAVDESRVAFHAGAGTLAGFPEYENNLNQHSIGIELLGIGTQEEMSLYVTAAEYDALAPDLIGFTDAQYEALNWLLHDILARHPMIQPNRTHIIGHSEYSPTKNDPGALFEWERLDFMNR
ncbi:MAG: N-acetylmuramoyl-L-alanine amidase [Oscillospiraceae bacterium]|nr:N-acetylmuramoyl-L-alanine amidase [Oscillospiraceae bacterium]